jgi:hypothetical protein
MPPPWANLLLALAAFISGGAIAVSGRLWLFGFVGLIAGAIFQSALIWYLVVLYVVGTLVFGALRGDDMRKGPSDAPGTGEGSSGSGGMEG